MPRNIESQSSPDPEKKSIIMIGEKEFKKGDFVSYDNGDGIEKDWILIGPVPEGLVIYKYVGGKKIGDPVTYTDKTISMDEFIEYNAEESNK